MYYHIRRDRPFWQRRVLDSMYKVVAIIGFISQRSEIHDDAELSLDEYASMFVTEDNMLDHEGCFIVTPEVKEKLGYMVKCYPPYINIFDLMMEYDVGKHISAMLRVYDYLMNGDDFYHELEKLNRGKMEEPIYLDDFIELFMDISKLITMYC